MENACRRCGGSGRRDEDICPACDGTGSRLMALIWRAYLRGVRAGMDAIRNSLPVFPEGEMQGADQLLTEILKQDEGGSRS